jgi:hypothetical protein
MTASYCPQVRASDWFEPDPYLEWRKPDRKESVHAAKLTLIGERVAKALADAHSPGLEERFLQQADKWERETRHLSSPTQKVMHPSYQAILGMGRDVVPLMLRDLAHHRREWFWALSYLTQDNPIKREDAGRMDKMIAAWVNWGKERNLF